MTFKKSPDFNIDFLCEINITVKSEKYKVFVYQQCLSFVVLYYLSSYTFDLGLYCAEIPCRVVFLLKNEALYLLDHPRRVFVIDSIQFEFFIRFKEVQF